MNDSDDSSVIGVIEGQGAPIASASSFDIVTGGTGYAFTNTNNIPLVSLTGTGSGAQCSVSLMYSMCVQ